MFLRTLSIVPPWTKAYTRISTRTSLLQGMIKDEPRASHFHLRHVPQVQIRWKSFRASMVLQGFPEGEGAAGSNRARKRPWPHRSSLPGFCRACGIDHPFHGKGAREGQDGTGGRAARGAEQGTADELVEFGDDLVLYVEGLNRLTVYRGNVPGQVWRTLVFIADPQPGADHSQDGLSGFPGDEAGRRSSPANQCPADRSGKV
jgi:hypothetical protein